MSRMLQSTDYSPFRDATLTSMMSSGLEGKWSLHSLQTRMQQMTAKARYPKVSQQEGLPKHVEGDTLHVHSIDYRLYILTMNVGIQGICYTQETKIL